MPGKTYMLFPWPGCASPLLVIYVGKGSARSKEDTLVGGSWHPRRCIQPWFRGWRGEDDGAVLRVDFVDAIEVLLIEGLVDGG